MSDSLELEPTPASVAAARRWSVQQLGPGHPAEVADTLALLVSELVSNVVLHARTSCTLVVHDHGGRVRVEVRDGSDRLPGTQVRADLLAQSGRGMVLVGGLSSSHGVDRLPVGGKCVWFELEVPPAP